MVLARRPGWVLGVSLPLDPLVSFLREGLLSIFFAWFYVSFTGFVGLYRCLRVDRGML